MKKFYTLVSVALVALMGAVNANAFDMTFNVADGSTIKEFDGRFEISVTGATVENLTVEQYGYVSFHRVNEGQSDKLLASASSQIDNSTGKIIIDFPSYNLWPDYPVQTAGTYKITIPANLITFGAEKNAETVINFTIVPEAKFVTTEDVTVSPAPGNFEEIMSELTIQLPDYVTSVGFNEVAAGSSSYNGTITAKAQFCQLYNGMVGNSVGEFDIVANGNVLTLTPTDKLLSAKFSAGTWVVRILRGAMYFNGDTEKINENIVLGEWVYPEMQAVEISPQSGLTIVDMSKFTLDFPISSPVETTINSEVSPKLYVLDETENTFKVVDADISLTKVSETKVTLNVADTDMPYGTYQLEIPKAQFSFDIYNQDWNTGDVTYAKTLVNARQMATYKYIAMPELDLTPVWSIEEGASINEFKDVTLTFEQASQISLINSYSEPFITINQVVDGEATPWGGGLGQLSVEIEGNSVRLYMSQYSFDPNYIAVDGEYRVIVPAGKLAFEGISQYTNTEDYVLNFKVDAADAAITAENATINPAPGVVETLNNVYTITIDGVEGVISTAEGAVAKLMTSMGSYTYQIGQYDLSVESNVITLTPSANMSTYWDPGKYYIQIDRGVLMVDNDQAKSNDVLSYGPYVIERLILGEITDPVAGVVESLSTFTLQLVDAYKEPVSTTEFPIVISKFDAASDSYVDLDNAVSTTTGFDANGQCRFTLQLSNEITEAGKYKLTIPKGAYKWEDSYFGEIYYNDLVVAEYEIKVNSATAFAIKSVDPQEGEVETLSVITISFDDQYFAAGLWNNEKTVNVINASDEVVTTGSVATSEANANIVITLAQPVTEKGEYVVVVPEGAVEDYNDKSIANPEIKLNYVISVSGIESVIADAENVDVYATSGILIKKNASKTDLNNLVPGIYVINGKKVCIMSK